MKKFLLLALVATLSLCVNAAKPGKSALKIERKATITSVKRNAVAPKGTAYAVPHTFSMDNATDWANCTVIDANNDGKTWTNYSGERAVYVYHEKNKANDWLIFPAVNLQAGKNYKVTVMIHGSEVSFPEIFEVKMGADVTAEAMTTEVIPETELRDNQSRMVPHVSEPFACAADGDYHFGIHALSKPDMMQIYVYSLAVEEVAGADAPKAVSDLTLTPAAGGAREVTVHFTLPTTTEAGDPLTGDATYEIARNNEAVATATAALGSEVTFVDNTITSDGEQNYSVRVTVGGKESKAATANVYVGLDTPAAVESFNAKLLTLGVDFSWSAVNTVGKNGGYVNPAEAKYKLYTLQEIMGGLYRDAIIRTTSAGDTSWHCPWSDFNDDNPVQYPQYFAIYPFNEVGEGEGTVAGVICGKNYSLPFVESVTDAQLHYYWAYEDAPYGACSLDATTESSDGDGYALLLSTYAINSQMMLYSGKIDISKAENPVISVDAQDKGTGSKLTVMVCGPDMQFHQLGEAVTLTNGYKNYAFSLADYKENDFVLVAFLVNFEKSSSVALLDNIRVFDLQANAVSVNVGEVPERMPLGETVAVTVKVTNEGQQAINNLKVSATLGDTELATTGFELSAPLEFGKSVAGTIEVGLDVFNSCGPCTLKISAVSLDGESQLAKDEFTQEITFVGANANSVENVEASIENKKINVSWLAPAKMMHRVAEDFESYTPWEITGAGDWKFINNDNAYGGSIFETVTLPVDGKQYAYTVARLRDLGVAVDNTLPAHSGKQMLYTSYGVTADGTDYAETTNDWLVSPELPGIEQTVKFWVQDYSEQPIHYHVYYSTTGTEIADFTEIGGSRGTKFTDDWEAASFDLPEGARYFAIERVNGYYSPGMYFLLDDFSFVTMGGSVQKYRVYFDEEFVGETTDTSYEFDCPSGLDGEHHVGVTAVNDTDNESLPATAIVDFSGVAGVNVAADVAHDVYNVTGQLVARGVKNLNSLAPGVYIIGGKKVVK